MFPHPHDAGGIPDVAPQDAAIDLQHVAKAYRGRVHALRGVRMHVRRGEVFGLLGPNGAGKSTLVKIMMTVVWPTHAEGTLLGKPLGHVPTLARVGYLPEHSRFPPYLTGRQMVEFSAALCKKDRRTRKRRTGELLELLNMTDAADRAMRTYSKGMLQRIGLAQALVHDPDLVVLDEPTDGLDPLGRRDVRELLTLLRDQGKTVFLNSHLLGEVERVCNRIAILVDGLVVRQGTLESLTAGSEHYEIELSGPDPARMPGAIRETLGLAPPAAASPEQVRETDAFASESVLLASGLKVEYRDRTLHALTSDAAAIQPLLDSLLARGLWIVAVRPVRQSLEDFFVQVVHDAQSPEPLDAVPVGGNP